MYGSGSLPSQLRAQARLLSIAGFQALALAFPFTLFQVALALSGQSSPYAPLVFGAPALVIGYTLCRLAARRLVRACEMEALA